MVDMYTCYKGKHQGVSNLLSTNYHLMSRISSAYHLLNIIFFCVPPNQSRSPNRYVVWYFFHLKCFCVPLSTCSCTTGCEPLVYMICGWIIDQDQSLNGGGNYNKNFKSLSCLGDRGLERRISHCQKSNLITSSKVRSQC
jgi:hypothetical protein